MLAPGHSTSQSFWTSSSFTFKFYLLLTISIFILVMLTPSSQFFIDNAYLTIYSHSYYKLFASFLATAPNLMSIVSIAFSFLWLHKLFKDAEESTVYRLVEVILINFEVHILFNLLALVLIWLFHDLDDSTFIGYGWFNVILVYQFRLSVANPDAQRYFCFIPFSIKGRYYPYVVMILILAFTQQVLCLMAAIFIGLYQEIYRKQMLIRLPYKFYTFLELCVPKFIQSRNDYMPISKNKQKVLSKCWFSSNLPESGNQDHVFKLEGIELGGRYRRHANGYKEYWEYRNNQMEEDTVETYRQMKQRQRQKQIQIKQKWLQELSKESLDRDVRAKIDSEPIERARTQMEAQIHQKTVTKELLLKKDKEQLIYD